VIQPPPLEFAFTIRAEIGTVLRAGPGAFGERQHIPITGGSVEGPMLHGAILPGGSDWALTRFDGHSVIDAHYTVRASDGTLIYVHNRGLRVCSAAVLDRMRRGEVVAPVDVYFRSAPVFDAPDGVHRWLSDHIFVAELARSANGVVVNVFVVK
jgi:hypothetical protein